MRATRTLDRVPVPDLCVLWAETPTAPMHMALIGVLDQDALTGPGPGDPATVLRCVRAAVLANLHRAPMLRKVLHRTWPGEGRPVWTDARDFEIARHVVLAAPPSTPEDEEAFLSWCAQRSVIPLDRTRPLWRMDVVPGLPHRRVGVLVVLHHVVADGLRGVALISSLLDPVPQPHPASPPDWRPEPPPSPADLVRENLRARLDALRRVRPTRLARSLRALRALVREPGGPAPATLLTGQIRPGRRLVVERFALEDLRARAHADGCSVNELLLDAVTTGLRDVLRAHDACPEGLVLRASVPVGARAGRDGGMLMAPLPVGVADADSRRRIIVEATRPRRDRADQGVAGIVTMPAGVARLAVLWARRAAPRHINLYVTNVPGPPDALYLAGARLLDVVPMAPLVAGVRLSVTALSYDGQFVVTLLGDDALDGLPLLGSSLCAALTGLPDPATARSRRTT